MIDLYEIGVSLILDDGITGKLDGVTKQFSVIDEAIAKINGELLKTKTAIADVAGATSGLAASWTSAAEAAERMSAAVSSFHGAGGGGGGASGGDGPTYLPASGTPGVPALIPGQPYYSGDDGNTFYRSGYVPNWTNGGGGGGLPPDESFGGGGPVPFYPGQSRAAGGGGGFADYYFSASMAYDVAKEAIGAPFDAAATVDQKLAVLRANGMSAGEAQSSYALAQSMQQNPQYKTLTIDDLLGILQGNFLQTRSASEAQGMLPQMANAATVLQGIGDADIQDQMFDLLRSGDLAGLLNDKGKNGLPDLSRLNKFVQTFTDIELATGDAVSPSQMVRLFQNLGPAALSLDSQGLGTTMLMALSLGQLKTGTGLNQMFKELSGGKMSKATEEFLVKQGIIDGSKVEGKSGDYVQMAPGALVDEGGFLADPQSWFVKHIGGDLSADSPEDRQKLISTIYASAGTAQGARVVADSIFQNALLMRYLTGASQMAPLAQLAAEFDNTPTGTASGAKAAGNALLVTLSQETMGALKTMLNWGTNLANDASNSAQGHPTETLMGLADAAYGVLWGTLKGAAHWPGIKGAGAAADVMGKLFEPLLWAETLYDTAGPGSEKRMDAWGNDLGLPVWMTDPQALSKNIVPGIERALEKQTSALVSAIKGQRTSAPSQTPMPTGPTLPLPGQTMPMPGRTNHF